VNSIRVRQLALSLRDQGEIAPDLADALADALADRELDFVIQVAQAVRERDPQSLAPLHGDALPDELAPLVQREGETIFVPLKLVRWANRAGLHETQLAGVEVADAGQHQRQVGVADAEPAGQRGGVLVHRRGGQQAALADVVGTA